MLDGVYTVSLTEPVLFRKNSPLFIDEVENINKKEKSGLRELLNVAYKKGGTVERARKIEKTGEVVIDSFKVFRPIGMANIEGMDDVLEDRCIKIVLERSFDKEITRRMEMFDLDQEIQKTMARCRLCRYISQKRYTSILNSIYYATLTTHNYTTTLTTLNDTYDTNLILKKIDNTELLGRDLELWLPLFVVSNYISEELLDNMVKMAEESAKERAIQNTMENRDIILINFIYQNASNFLTGGFVPVSSIVQQYKNENSEEDWFNSRWVGRALVRLNLLIDKRRVKEGREVILNKEKINEKAVRFGLANGQMKV
jgi:hypothetical protein